MELLVADAARYRVCARARARAGVCFVVQVSASCPRRAAWAAGQHRHSGYESTADQHEPTGRQSAAPTAMS